MIDCCLLTAGKSSRFGSPKAIAAFDKQQTVIQHVLENLLNSRLNRIIVVLGFDQERIKPYLLKHTNLTVVYNKDHFLGQTSSIQVGLRSTSPNCTGTMIYPIDYPAIKTSTIDRLIGYFLDHEPGILIPTFSGRRGHPPIFHRRLKGEIEQLPADQGLDTVVHQDPQRIHHLASTDQGVVQTFNTPDELDIIKKTLT